MSTQIYDFDNVLMQDSSCFSPDSEFYPRTFNFNGFVYSIPDSSGFSPDSEFYPKPRIYSSRRLDETPKKKEEHIETADERLRRILDENSEPGVM